MWKEREEEAWRTGGTFAEEDYGSSSSSTLFDSSSGDCFDSSSSFFFNSGSGAAEAEDAAAGEQPHNEEEAAAALAVGGGEGGGAAAAGREGGAATSLYDSRAAVTATAEGGGREKGGREGGKEEEGEKSGKKKRLRASCRVCGCDELESNEARGELVCCRCGTVLEETALVDSLQFSESATGSISMVGQFVPSCGGISSRSAAGRSGLAGLGSSDSREIALQRGFHNIQSIAESLKLASQQHLSAALRLYLMASQRNFTLGRRSLLVASACLYTICRREKTPHLLIDFCDVLRTSVRALGQVFMKLLRVVHVQVPHVDPSLFMERFASQISLGDKTLAVAQTGVRLIQAMSRDWICTGRRPTGLCGAALLIAARYHHFPVDAAQVAQVVRVSSPTVNKRLQEFRQTAAARLPASAFEETDLLSLPSVGQPPCCMQRDRAKREKKEKSEAVNHTNSSSSSRRALLDRPAADGANALTPTPRVDIASSSSSSPSSSSPSSSSPSSSSPSSSSPSSSSSSPSSSSSSSPSSSSSSSSPSSSSSSSSSSSFSSYSSSACSSASSISEEQQFLPVGRRQQQDGQQQGEAAAAADILRRRGGSAAAEGGRAGASADSEEEMEERRLLHGPSSCKAAVDLHVDTQLLCKESPSAGDILDLAGRIVSAIGEMPEQLLQASSTTAAAAAARPSRTPLSPPSRTAASADGALQEKGRETQGRRQLPRGEGGEEAANRKKEEEKGGGGRGEEAAEEEEAELLGVDVGGESSSLRHVSVEQLLAQDGEEMRDLQQQKGVTSSSSSPHSSTSSSSSSSSTSSSLFAGNGASATELDPLAQLLRGVQARGGGLLQPFSDSAAAAASADTSDKAQQQQQRMEGEAETAELRTDGQQIHTDTRSAAAAAATRPSAAAAASLSIAAAAGGVQRLSAGSQKQQQFREGKAGGGGTAAATVEEEEEEEEEELRRMLLTEPERKAKALIWDDLTKELMPLVHRRLKERRAREKQQQAKKAGMAGGKRGSRASGRFGAEITPMASAADSVRLALHRSSRSIVSKINDNVLDSLFSSPLPPVEAKEQQQHQLFSSLNLPF